MLTKLAHVSLIVRDTQRALQFYQKILKLEVDSSRPDLGFPGVWLNIGDQQIHLLELPNPDPVENRPSHGGRDRHVAFNIVKLEDILTALDHAGIKYTKSRFGRKALFCRDPDGNALEFIEISG